MPLRLPTLPLRRWILWPLVALFLLAVLAVTLLAQGAAQSAARDLGQAYAAEIGERISDPLAAELGALRRRVALNAEAMRLGRLPVDQPLDIAPSLYDQLRQASHVTFLSVALPDGRYLGAARLPEDDDAVHLAANFIDRPFELVGYRAGADGRPAGVYGREAPKAYDPRERDFFRRAQASNGPVWGQIESYVGWTAFGIGISAPVRDDDGTLLAVAGGAIALERLANVIAALRLPEGGLVAVIDAQGRLVASSTAAPLATGEPGRAQRVALADHPHPVAAPLAALLAQPKDRRETLRDADGVAYLYDLRELRAPDDLGWWIAVVLPEATFTEPLGFGRGRLLLLIALVLALVGGLGIGLAQAVMAPLERVSAAAARGELAELARREARASRVEEVARLSEALGGLAEALQASIAELEDRVAERTRALEDANAQLLALSLRDPLTGIGNRRSFDEALVREWGAAVRRAEPLALLIIDVDHFKRLNDAHGHLVGDEVLKAIARAVTGVLRRSVDLVARFGGEEFVVLLPDTPLAEALALAGRLREAVAGRELVPGVGTITVSVGLAVATPSPSEAPSALLAAADAALYRAKSAGRDRVEAAAPSA